jgi:hypothetical protein
MSNMNNTAGLNCDICGVAHSSNQHPWNIRTTTVDQLACDSCFNQHKIADLVKYRQLHVDYKRMILCIACHRLKGSGMHSELCDPCHIKNLTATANRLIDNLEKQQEENHILKQSIRVKNESIETLREINSQLITEVETLKKKKQSTTRKDEAFVLSSQNIFANLQANNSN